MILIDQTILKIKNYEKDKTEVVVNSKTVRGGESRETYSFLNGVYKDHIYFREPRQILNINSILVHWINSGITKQRKQ